MYPAITVAEYIIERCNALGNTISNLKLQKILYFVQAESLVSKGIPCFSECIEAWDFGPVVPVVYHRYKVYGGANIPCITQSYFPFSSQDIALLNGIIDECAKYTASALVEITHRQDPWVKAYTPCTNAIISNESIKAFFEEA